MQPLGHDPLAASPAPAGRHRGTGARRPGRAPAGRGPARLVRPRLLGPDGTPPAIVTLDAEELLHDGRAGAGPGGCTRASHTSTASAVSCSRRCASSRGPPSSAMRTGTSSSTPRGARARRRRAAVAGVRTRRLRRQAAAGPALRAVLLRRAALRPGHRNSSIRRLAPHDVRRARPRRARGFPTGTFTHGSARGSGRSRITTRTTPCWNRSTGSAGGAAGRRPGEAGACARRRRTPARRWSPTSTRSGGRCGV